jgi:putative cell wall-binding protein
MNHFSDIRRRLHGIVAALSAAVVIIGLSVASPATASSLDEPVDEPRAVVDRAIVDSGELSSVASKADFDPGYLISDAQFYERGAMTESEIQAFLERMVGTCGNSNCLAQYRQSTVTKTATERCTGTYTGAENERASRIIYKVQQACGISAKVILVTLQKEQSLITLSAPSSSRLERAMGYYCPDDPSRPGWCDPRFAGFQNQVYNASAQFHRYRLNPTNYAYRIGTVRIQYHPNSACGTKSVTIRNAATAGLYIYTPYTPNAAALNNLYGTGDSCSSYGNRNFWRLFTDWFGSPTGRMPSSVVASRISGDDRFSTSVEVSSAAYAEAPGGGTVFIATGAGFADGLAAAPAAAQVDAPLLLTARDTLPDSVRAEIVRLQPALIVIMGGTGAVSGRVEAQLAALAPAVRRDAGESRYATARQIARANFAGGATTAYLASGGNFPDALAASAAAGAEGAPVLLIPPGARSVDAATKQVLIDLGVTRVVLAGGTAVLSSDVASSVRSGTGVTTVVRRGGADRYKTAAAINDASFPDAEVMYLASGVSFADALSIAAIAGAEGRPLSLSAPTCLPAATAAYATLAGIQQVTLVGGTAVLSTAVGRFTPCR